MIDEFNGVIPHNFTTRRQTRWRSISKKQRICFLSFAQLLVLWLLRTSIPASVFSSQISKKGTGCYYTPTKVYSVGVTQKPSLNSV
jgi:hypothetical protein